MVIAELYLEYSASTFERSLNFVADLVRTEPKKSTNQKLLKVSFFILAFIGHRAVFEYIWL